jgi:DNA-directed RNA polymerase specialized sigma subunit
VSREARITKNLPLVRYLAACKYPDLAHTHHFEDLVQAGSIGLILAVDAYYYGNTKIGVSFAKYARTCILSELHDFEARSLTALLPARERRERVAIRRRWGELARNLGREPTPAELRESWPSRAHKLGDAVIARALDAQPKLYFGLDASDSSDYPHIGVDSRIEESIEAKRTLDKLDAIEPIDARLRRAV